MSDDKSKPDPESANAAKDTPARPATPTSGAAEESGDTPPAGRAREAFPMPTPATPARRTASDGDASASATVDTDAPAPANDDAGAADACGATPPRWLGYLGRPGIAPALLMLISLMAFLPGLVGVPPLDRDEPRFAQASKQMVETGNFADIRFQQATRYKKPVGIYWLQAAAAKVSGYGADAPIWVYRLPSLLGALFAVLLTYWAARAFVGPPQALLAGLFVALAVIVGVEARLAKTDAVLLATVLASQGALARMWLAGNIRQPIRLIAVFWVALGLGILVKGPVAPMIVGLTILALAVTTRRLRWMLSLRPLFGVLVLVVLVAPWFIAIGIATRGAFFSEAIGNDLMAKLAQGQESHGAPPLTHLAASLLTFWPLPAFLIASIGQIVRDRRSDVVRFCLAWAVPSWIVFEVVATKLPHYTMPLLPALAILSAVALVRAADTVSRKWLRWVVAVLLTALPIAIALVAVAAPLALSTSPSPPGVVLCAFAAIAIVYAARKLLHAPAIHAVPRAALAALLLYAGVWGYSFAALAPIWVSPRLVAAAQAATTCPSASVFSVGFNEPSFIFLAGTQTRLGTAEDAATWLAGGKCRVAVVEKQFEDAFLATAKREGVALTLTSRVQGLNINGGHKLDIAVYRQAGS